MNKRVPPFSLKIAVMLIAFFFSLCFSSFAAEVFYLGSGGSAGGGKLGQDYTFKERLADLVNFTANTDSDTDRSGSISGRFLVEFAAQSVSGNKSKSFYSHEGADFKSELNVVLKEKIYNDYSLEGEVFLRKTDNPRVEVRRDIRMKQLSLRLGNDDNYVRFGDLYTDFSQFTLGASLEGFDMEVNPTENQTYKAVAAQAQKSDSTADQYQRFVFGTKGDWRFLQESKYFSLVRIGAQLVNTQDDSSSAPELSTSNDLDNTVMSVDGELRLRKFFSVVFELARSFYTENDDADTKDRKHGMAFKVEPAVKLFDNSLLVKYLYYYVQPEFYTALGSASTDKQQHQFSIDWRISARATLSLVENLYWDHLESSLRTKRTVYDEKYITLNLRPLEARDNFSVRTYFNFLEKSSDDEANSAESNTGTVGFSINDRIAGASVGTFYEYRAYDDRGTPTNSEYFHRFGFNVSRDWQIFERRFYLSCNYSSDLRNTKRDEDKDVNTGLSFSGQYEVLDPVILRFGYNIQNANNSGPDTDYDNFKSHVEFDYALSKKWATHLVLRGEYNRYDHEDGTQDYNERLFLSRFVTNF